MAKKNKTIEKVHTAGTNRGYYQTPKGKMVQYREGLKKGVGVDPRTKTVHTNPQGGSTMETKAVRTVKGRSAKGGTEYGKWRPNKRATTYEEGNLRSYMPKSAMKFADKMQTSKVVGTPSPKYETKKKKK